MNRAVLLVVLLLPTVSRAGGDLVSVRIPLAGRPENFSGASGRFVLETEVQPDAVAVEEPCILRVYITATGPVVAPPEQLVLSESLYADFHVEELGLFPSMSETVRAATLFGLGSANSDPLLSLAGTMPPRSWEFRYRLRPKRETVDEIPDIAFCFHDPFLMTASRPFMVEYADPLPFRVLKPQPYQTPRLTGAEPLFAWLPGLSLDRTNSPTLPGPLALTLLALLPIVGCLVWYRVWQRLYPDDAHQATIRRSRAARIALADLARLRTPLDRPAATRAAGVLARYLRERFDLPPGEPTPIEVADHLRQRGLSDSQGQGVHDLLARLDAHRFGTPAPEPDDLVAALRRRILALEEESCQPSS